MSTKDLVVFKIRQMEADNKFLEWVWTELSQDLKIKLVNNFIGHVPEKFTK